MKIFETIPTEKPDSLILDNISEPSALRALELSQLPKVADELREYLLYTVGQTGGHFGAGLGVVELTLALHRAIRLCCYTVTPLCTKMLYLPMRNFNLLCCLSLVYNINIFTGQSFWL